VTQNCRRRRSGDVSRASPLGFRAAGASGTQHGRCKWWLATLLQPTRIRWQIGSLLSCVETICSSCSQFPNHPRWFPFSASACWL